MIAIEGQEEELDKDELYFNKAISLSKVFTVIRR